MKKLVLGILSHVDSGKTTLSEALLYKSGTIRKLGRVDDGSAFLDTYSLERDRGITIFSKQAILNFGDTYVTLLDTPGHVDFSSEMERTLQVLDYAILVISGTDGIQSHTETLWKLLKDIMFRHLFSLIKWIWSERIRVMLCVLSGESLAKAVWIFLALPMKMRETRLFRFVTREF